VRSDHALTISALESGPALSRPMITRPNSRPCKERENAGLGCLQRPTVAEHLIKVHESCHATVASRESYSGVRTSCSRLPACAVYQQEWHNPEQSILDGTSLFLRNFGFLGYSDRNARVSAKDLGQVLADHINNQCSSDQVAVPAPGKSTVHDWKKISEKLRAQVAARHSTQ
jgi:hypothetical protein